MTPLFAREVGRGPDLVLVHGSASSAEGWLEQLRGLKDDFRMLAVDRRGTARSALPEGVAAWSVEDHAADLAAFIEARADRPVVCGSSFGAVCVLHLARSRPELLRGAILCEPPLPPREELPPALKAQLDAFHRILEAGGGAPAARFFLRHVLGEADYARLPAAWIEHAERQWRQIALDVSALEAYRPNFDELRQVRVPTLMVGGERSEGYFVLTLERLRMALPESARLTLHGAGHMMHVDAPEAFNRTVKAFAERFIGDG